ncbi:MAG TPA: flagellar hook-basal body complex protein FliE [Burkholderiales bacterium]|nr:flagellar hook-basal body complex protein FliE [Burkholderiales bacterium]
MEVKALDDVLAQLQAASTLAQGTPLPASSANAGGVDFAAALRSALDGVNATQNQALTLAQDFERGAPNVELHNVAIGLQKANLEFQATVQIRNKLVTAYNDIMNMQI